MLIIYNEKLQKGNDLVGQLVLKYVDRQTEKHIGKPFNEVYDIESVQPKPEWQTMYEEVLQELKTHFGLNL